MSRAFIATAIALGCVATMARAKSEQGAPRTSGYSMTVNGYVPVICRAETGVAAVPAQAGAVSLGALREYCNSPNGYEVYTDYSPALAGASLSIDGRKVRLDASGTTRIDKSNRAAIVSRDVSLILPEGVAPGTIAFRIVAMQR